MYLLGDTIHELIHLRDADGERIDEFPTVISTATLLFHDNVLVDTIMNLAYVSVSSEEAGTYSIDIDTSHGSFPGVGSYHLWRYDVFDPVTGDVDHFGGPYVVYAAADFMADVSDIEERVKDAADFIIDNYEYDSSRRPISAVKTFASGRIVDITLSYDDNGKLEYSEEERGS